MDELKCRMNAIEVRISESEDQVGGTPSENIKKGKKKKKIEGTKEKLRDMTGRGKKCQCPFNMNSRKIKELMEERKN